MKSERLLKRCPACMLAIPRELELPGAAIACPNKKCARPLVFDPDGWELRDRADVIGVALETRASEMLAYAEATLDLVLSAPLGSLERTTPSTARALINFIDGVCSGTAATAVERTKLIAARAVLANAHAVVRTERAHEN